MSNNVIYKNKGETFKCSFDIDGATSTDMKVRLCLEFNDNKNMFFHGKIDKKGNCTVSIPKLNELDDKQGNLRIEAIIDDTYFNLYECPIEIKNSVQVKIKENTGTFLNNATTSSGVRVQIGKLEKETVLSEEKEENEENEEKEEKEEENKEENEEEAEKEGKEKISKKNTSKEKNNETESNGWKKIDPSELWKNKKHQKTNEPEDTSEEKPKSSGKFKSFQDYVSKKK